jgi:hypothetical protein
MLPSRCTLIAKAHLRLKKLIVDPRPVMTGTR